MNACVPTRTYCRIPRRRGEYPIDAYVRVNDRETPPRARVRERPLSAVSSGGHRNGVGERS